MNFTLKILFLYIVLNKVIVTCFIYRQTRNGKTFTMKSIQNLVINSLLEERANMSKNSEFYVRFF